MHFLRSLLPLALAAIGTALPSGPLIQNTTAASSSLTSGSTNDSPVLLRLWSEPNLQVSFWNYYSSQADAAMCIRYPDVDEPWYGGISSLQSFTRPDKHVYHCLNYITTDCTPINRLAPSVFWFKGPVTNNRIPKDFDNQIHSTRCHLGNSPWYIPGQAGAAAETLDPAMFQEIALEAQDEQ